MPIIYGEMNIVRSHLTIFTLASLMGVLIVFAKLIGNLYSAFTINYKDLEYRYLSEAIDIVDLERRMREIDRGQAPYQR